jgi:hypothetical protein
MWKTDLEFLSDIIEHPNDLNLTLWMNHILVKELYTQQYGISKESYFSVIWDKTLCGLLKVNQCVRGACCFHRQG